MPASSFFSHRPRPAALLLPALLLGATGCVQRTIHLDSTPPGALVYLNDQEVGRTPVRVPFTFYGTYDVRLEKEGYQPLWTKQTAKAPFWEYPGPDLIAEAIPGMKSNLFWHFELQPEPAAGDVQLDQLLDHAQQMRAMTRHPD